MKTSEQIDQLATALAIVQGSLQTVTKDGKAQHGKYAKLEDIITTASPILSTNGLCVVQMPIIASDTRIGMVTRIMHKSGQWIESDPISSKLDKDNAQGVGSCISYLRRYQINAMLFLGAADDDGNAACDRDIENAPHKGGSISSQDLSKKEGFVPNIISKGESAPAPNTVKLFNREDPAQVEWMHKFLKSKNAKESMWDALIKEFHGKSFQEIKGYHV